MCGRRVSMVVFTCSAVSAGLVEASGERGGAASAARRVLLIVDGRRVCVGHVCSTLALRRTCVRDCSLCSVIPGQVRGDLRDFWRLALYPVVLVVCWLPGTINRVNNSLHPGTPMHARMFAWRVAGFACRCRPIGPAACYVGASSSAPT